MADAISFVGPLLNRLLVVLTTEGKALASVGNEIVLLRDKLVWLHSWVHDAERCRWTDGNKEISLLACQVRKVAFAAEDTVDHFSLVALGGHDWRWAAAMFFANFCTQIRVRYIVSRKIKHLKARQEGIVKNYNTKFSSNNVSAAAIPWRASCTIPPVRHNWDESQQGRKKVSALKRNKEKKRLIKLLNKEPDSPVISVIYVVGESGMGKRYLVRKAYEDPTIKNNFVVCIWENFPPVTPETSNDIKKLEDQIKKKLEDEWNKPVYREKDLKEVKCLIVVDCPMGSTTLGESIEKMLINKCGKGSKIVLTATSIPPDKNVDSIKLVHLDKARSETLFNYAVGLEGRRKSNYKTNKLDMVRERLEEITNHLPLAVVILAKFMRTMDYRKWEGALDYINNKQDGLLETIVYTGIDDLPDELKSCLLYTTGFPESSTIPARQLVRLWMAEGFLTQQSGVKPDELGQRYLKELIFRGLVQLVKKERGRDVVQAVAIHELVHQFFRWEAQRTAFMVTHYGGFASRQPDSSRRLALALNSKKLSGTKLPVLMKLRTVLSHVHDDQHIHAEPEGSPDFKEGFRQLLKHSSFLRVISLEGIDIGEKLPCQIGNMLHLQYLGVRCPTLKTVPKSIGKLRKLQTMDVRGTQVTKLPTSFWKIETLCHVLGNDNLHFPNDSALKLKTEDETQAHEGEATQLETPMQTEDETQAHEVEATQLETPMQTEDETQAHEREATQLETPVMNPSSNDTDDASSKAGNNGPSKDGSARQSKRTTKPNPRFFGSMWSS